MKNAAAKSLLTIILALSGASGGTAQTSCDLTSKTAPLLLNLLIGSSSEQARNAFGRDLKIKIKKKGARTFFQNYIRKPAPESLRGVRALYLRFFNDRLYQIEIFYEPRRDLPTLETVIGALSNQLNLPAAEWKTQGVRAAINCTDQSLVADYVLNPRVQLTEETIRAAIELKREKDRKK